MGLQNKTNCPGRRRGKSETGPPCQGEEVPAAGKGAMNPPGCTALARRLARQQGTVKTQLWGGDKSRKEPVL